jgi:redox-sensitive bicupin YhaK (pirin superfamily)
MESTQTTEVRRNRSIAAVLPAVETLEGEGFVVRRPFPVPGHEQIDPFLLLDHMGPRDLAPGEAKGAPDHPHRGFETVTYVLEGEFEHEDSAGHSGRLGAGDVQWMTAGAGVVHSEMPSARLQTEGGRLHALQLWVNLPAADKMTPPRYQEYAAERIPSVERDGVVARVVAGRFGEVSGAVETHIPITYLHLTMQPGGEVELPLPADQNAMAYVIGGEVEVGESRASEASLVLFRRDGDRITLHVPSNATGPADVLVLAATPINEPLARYGPFVMNTRAEIIQAVEDFQAGRMGTIPGRVG